MIEVCNYHIEPCCAPVGMFPPWAMAAMMNMPGFQYPMNMMPQPPPAVKSMSTGGAAGAGRSGSKSKTAPAGAVQPAGGVGSAAGVGGMMAPPGFPPGALTAMQSGWILPPFSMLPMFGGAESQVREWSGLQKH